jgi:hypothetical protein
MLDLSTTQDSRGLVAIKILSVYLGLLIASMFFLPVEYNTYPDPVILWRWSFLTNENSIYFMHFFDNNIGLATLATIINYIPDLISVVLSIAAICIIARRRKAGVPQSIWKSNVVLGALCYNVAITAWRASSAMNGFLTQAITSNVEYLLQGGLYFLWFSEDEIILCILALYLVVYAWKNYRYP